MKVKNTVLIFFILTLSLKNASAQAFVEAFQNIETYTNEVKIPVKFVSCIRNGEDVTIEFEIGNNLSIDLDIRKFGSDKTQGFMLTEASSIIDNTGYDHGLHSATIGRKTELKYSGASWVNGFFSLSKGTRVKANMVIKGVSQSATSFKKVKISFNNPVNGAHYTRYFTFANVPILSLADIARLEEEYKRKVFEKLLAKANKGDADAQYEVGVTYYNNNEHAKGFNYLIKSADGGNTEAQGSVAYLYLHGNGSPDRDLRKDYALALPYAQKSAEKGNVMAHFVLAVLYDGGVVEGDKNKVIEHLTYAANRDFAEAQSWLGIKYMGVDNTLSAQWYKKAADNGDISGIRSTGDNYYSGKGVLSNKEKALEYYLKGVAQNDAQCLYEAGLMYRRGIGCTQDLVKAKNLLLESVAQDNVDSFRELAFYYRYNEVDDLKAIDYFNRAIEKGDHHSQPYLAEMYEKGIGTLKNPTKAKELYTQSAEKGNSNSQYRLGVMAKELNQLTEAFSWFSKSAEGGLSDAQYETGLMYYYAKGTAKNNKKAAEYIEKAHKQGNKEAEKVWNNLQLWKYM